MESPFQLAHRLPKDTRKSVTDAWNGNHSVPLHKSDQQLNTIIGIGVPHKHLRGSFHQETAITTTSMLSYHPSARNIVLMTQSTTTKNWNNTGGEPSTCSCTLAKQALCLTWTSSSSHKGKRTLQASESPRPRSNPSQNTSTQLGIFHPQPQLQISVAGSALSLRWQIMPKSAI